MDHFFFFFFFLYTRKTNGHFKGKGAFKHAQNMQIQITMCIRHVSFRNIIHSVISNDSISGQ